MPDKKQEIQKRDMTSRSIHVRAKTINEEDRSVEAVLNTEKRVQVFDWRSWELIDEILLADGMRVEGDQVVMLDSHRRYGTETVIGSIREIRTENGQNIGRLVFAENDDTAERVWNLVRQGHLTDVSVGYRVDQAVDLKENTEQKIGSKVFKNDSRRVLRISKSWTLLETSPVPIGANSEAKVREAEEASTKTTEVKPNEKRKDIMGDENKVVQPEVVKVDTAKIEREAREKAAKQRGDEINEMYALAAEWNCRDLADQAVKENKDLDEFRKMVLDKNFENQQVIDTQRSDIGLSDKETENYSIVRAIQAMITGRHNDAGFEFRVSKEIAKTQKIELPDNRFLIPNEVLHRINHIDPRQATMWNQQRAMTIASGGTGLVGIDHLAASFIDMLRNRVSLLKLGARILSGLTGNVSLPKQTGASTFEWVTEGGAVTGGDPSFGSVTGSPKTGRTKVSFSRELLLQSSPELDGLVFDDISIENSKGFDLAGINGSGSGGAPTGLLNTSGIGDVIGAALDWPALVEFETDVKTANGDIGTMGYLTNAAVEGILKTREISSGYPKFLQENGRANNRPVEVSNQVPANTMLFGVFAQLWLLLWGVLAVEVDIFTDADNGNIVIRSFQSGDWIVRQAPAFSVSDEIS